MCLCAFIVIYMRQQTERTAPASRTVSLRCNCFELVRLGASELMDDLWSHELKRIRLVAKNHSSRDCRHRSTLVG